MLDNLRMKLQLDNNKKYLFRGQPEDLPLLPNIGRDSVTDIHEEAMLGEFKRFGLLHFQENPIEEISQPKNDFEWLVLAQHYGMKTRFLDWTQKFEIALFFAISDALDRDGVIWAFELPDNGSTEWLILDHKDIQGKTPFEFDQLKIYYPKPFLHSRSDNQYSVLTLHFNPEISMENQEEYNPRLKKVTIESARKQVLLGQLDSEYGVNYSYLFGGIEGISRYLNHKFSVN